MRSDYALYVVAAIFFVITAISASILADFERNLSVVATTILGLLFIGLGYTQRSTAKSIVTKAPPPPPRPSPPEPSLQEELQVTTKPVTQSMELTAIKGVKGKRAEQLKALGINDVEDLANSSAKDLAAKLKISLKFTEKWIENAKELVRKS